MNRPDLSNIRRASLLTFSIESSLLVLCFLLHTFYQAKAPFPGCIVIDGFQRSEVKRCRNLQVESKVRWSASVRGG
jgi:hypothetical protein